VPVGPGVALATEVVHQEDVAFFPGACLALQELRRPLSIKRREQLLGPGHGRQILIEGRQGRVQGHTEPGPGAWLPWEMVLVAQLVLEGAAPVSRQPREREPHNTLPEADRTPASYESSRPAAPRC
jgi:hypothetical protein